MNEMGMMGGKMEKDMKEMMEKCPMIKGKEVAGEENAAESNHESHH